MQHSGIVRWLAAAVVLQALGLGWGAWLWHRDAGGPAAPYTTLSAPESQHVPGARARVVFRPQASLDQVGRLLREVGAQIIDGPTDAGVYTLGFPVPAERREAVATRVDTLRGSSLVLVAEPAAAAGPGQ